MTHYAWYRASLAALLLSFLVGCSTQAPYMKRWEPVLGINHRWTDGTLLEAKMSEDESAVFQQHGTPDAIRFFREHETRQQVYEWVYMEPSQTFWFVDGQRAEYVMVDTTNSRDTGAQREQTVRKLRAGVIESLLVGGIAAGTLLFIK